MSVTSARRDPPPLFQALSLLFFFLLIRISLALLLLFIYVFQPSKFHLFLPLWWTGTGYAACFPSFNSISVNPNPVASLLLSHLLILTPSVFILFVTLFLTQPSHPSPLLVPPPPLFACISLCPSFHSLRYELCATSLPHERIILANEL